MQSAHLSCGMRKKLFEEHNTRTTIIMSVVMVTMVTRVTRDLQLQLRVDR